jgi:hypothetical protein
MVNAGLNSGAIEAGKTLEVSILIEKRDEMGLRLPGCPNRGQNASVSTVPEVSRLNSFSNNPLHSRAKQRARRREI